MGEESTAALFMEKTMVKEYNKVCIYCKKLFVASRSDRLYCSTTCSGKIRQKQINLTVNEWRSLREYILERDGYTCQDCGKFLMDLGLFIHHIKPIFRNGSNEPKNLITLCGKCHGIRYRIN